MKKHKGIPVGEWPPDDRAAFLGMSGPRSRRDRHYKYAGLAEKERRQLASNYGCCLAWLSSKAPIDVAAPAASRWTESVVAALVADMMRDYRPSSIRTRLQCLKRVLTILDPSCDLQHLDSEIRQLPRARPAGWSVALRISTDDLIRFGLEFMNEADRAPIVDIRQSIKFRTGLQIALLALRPWRADAFCRILIGDNLRKAGNYWHLTSKCNKSRNKRDANASFPDRLVPYLERYLAHHRRIICDGSDGGNALWIGQGGRPFSKGLLHYYVTKATRARFAIAVYPHAFRKCVATTIAIEKPDSIPIVPKVLGHSLVETSEHWYNMADSASAFGQLQGAIEEELREAQRGGPCCTRRRRRAR